MLKQRKEKQQSFFAKYTMRIKEISESEAGTTTSANMGVVVSPHLAIGKPSKSYTGSPGKSGTKAPKPPKTKMQKSTDNALNSKENIFGSGNTIKR